MAANKLPSLVSTNIFRTEVADGHLIVNDKPNGINWAKRWEVTATFSSQKDATAFRENLEKRRVK
jgi:hypothetical protein